MKHGCVKQEAQQRLLGENKPHAKLSFETENTAHSIKIGFWET